MRILFNQLKNPESIERSNSIADAIRYSGHEAGFNNMAILDALYDYKPDKYVTFSEPTEEEVYACEKRSVELVKAKEKVCANVFRYKPTPPLKELEVDQVCINDYGDHLSLMSWIDKRNPKTFRLFQPKLLSFDCYCGWIPTEYHSLVLSSAKEVICNNVQSLYNHLLCNERCRPTQDLIKFHELQENILSDLTCFHAAKEFIGDDALVGLEKYLCK